MTELVKGQVYVIAFWSARSFVPSAGLLPYLNALQEELKEIGIVFIAQSCHEKDTAEVGPFVEKRVPQTALRVVTDNTARRKAGFMLEKWVEASGAEDFLTAFVVDRDRKIAWFGHGARLSAVILRQVAEGTFDLKMAAAEKRAELAARPARKRASFKLNQALEAKDWDAANAIIDGLESLGIPNPTSIPHLRYLVASGQGDQPGMVKQAEEIMEAATWDLGGEMYTVIWDIALKLKNPSPDALAVAALAAEKAMAQNPNKQGFLVALARIQFLQGKPDEAIATQQKAIAWAGREADEDDDMEEMQEALESYQKGVLPPAE